MAAPLAALVLVLLVVLRVIKQQTPREVSLQTELKVLKAEQDEIDVKEEFAKHAKLQRKINKLTDELNSIRSSNLKLSVTIQWGVKIGLHILHKFCYVLLIWCFKEHPMVYLKEDWTWPLGRVLAFPSGQSGTIGVTWWVIACSLVIRKMHHLLKSQTLQTLKS
ncbi:guided entry of tail-anchored proteins factor 1-like isoform X2 [Apostichopus japonicus]|uniref:guided entry of tail-anchored proteins factor 1-like isoform X2 n=1 Tax=Stichopus japonicus TaxID=307972 RepID=UPI003AB33751